MLHRLSLYTSTAGQKVVALIETTLPICVERFVDYPQLGRFTLRDEGRTVAIGKVRGLCGAVVLFHSLASGLN
jgi:translation elongation factor EF-1alpha